MLPQNQFKQMKEKAPQNIMKQYSPLQKVEKQDCIVQIHQKSGNNLQNNKPQKILPRKKKNNHVSITWSSSQIAQLFSLYDISGPQWRGISILMKNRNSNTIKNQFYTVLRNILKCIFKKNSNKCPKLIGEISSKDLCRLYDGRQQYAPYKGFIQQILKSVGYDWQNPHLQSMVNANSQTILAIYELIYQQRKQQIQFYRGSQRAQEIQQEQNDNHQNNQAQLLEPIQLPIVEENIQVVRQPSIQNEMKEEVPLFYYVYMMPQQNQWWPL